MQLSSLLQGFIELPPELNIDVKRLVLDSRQIQAGDLFFAVKGAAMDGRQFIPAALKAGVAAILTDSDADYEAIIFNERTPIISIKHLKENIGLFAARFFGEPAKSLRMIGVTGTNGKTSCTHFMAQVLGMPAAVIGTLGSGMYGALGAAGLTTPDAITLQSMLCDFLKQHAAMVAMEVSSHSIDQGRINGIEFEMGVFTNLTQDHLDYHQTMQAYADVKKRFIQGPQTQHVMINADDDYGKQWILELASHKSVFAYSCKMNATERAALMVPFIHADNVQLSLQGIEADVHTPWGAARLSTPLIGEFNLSNVLAVIGTMCFYGRPLQDVIDRLAVVKPVPGRMQTVVRENKPLVVVDYAHTPDSLEKALRALRLHTKGKLICVFGCGGDRDKTKRPIMASIAEKLADKVFVTNDNPRNEVPETIAAEIMQGFKQPERVSVLLDRSKAIENSIQYAEICDCILVAGKGAETYQQIGSEKKHFDDVEEVIKYLS